MSKKNQRHIECEEGSGNVFADLGLEDADALFTRAQMGFHVYTILKDQKLKQREISSLLGIAQPDVSHLMNGHFSHLTTAILWTFFEREGLTKKATNWLNMSAQSHSNRFMAYDNCHRHSEADACGQSTAAEVSGRVVCHHSHLAGAQHLSQSESLLRLLRADPR